MNYISVDLETTGVDTERCQILSFSGILEDTNKLLDFLEIPKFNIYVLREEITGSPFAIKMNSEIIERISNYIECKTIDEKRIQKRIIDGVFLYEHEIPYYIYIWLLVHQEGLDEYKYLLDSDEWGNRKNGKFLGSINEIKNKYFKIVCNAAGKNFSSFDKKFIDRIRGAYDFFKIRQRVLDPSVLYMDWKSDDTLPSLSLCKERAGLDSYVSHDSIDDAWDVVVLLRKFYE
jgi:hypothetical protein